MNRTILVLVAGFAVACNAAPPNSCTPTSNAASAAGVAPLTCMGTCEPVGTFVGDAAAGEVCTMLDCAVAADAACSLVPGTSCLSVSVGDASVSACLFPCGGLTTCPTGQVCIPDAGVCL